MSSFYSYLILKAGLFHKFIVGSRGAGLTARILAFICFSEANLNEFTANRHPHHPNYLGSLV